MTVAQVLKVTSIRSQNPLGFGGCIFSAIPINDKGRRPDAKGNVVVKASNSALGGTQVESGQWWKITGKLSKRLLDINGLHLAETQIDATSALLLRPTGEHIVAFMGDSPNFRGIGRGKARKLWEAFGNSLYEHLDAGNVTELSKVLTPISAAQVAAAWAQHSERSTLQQLQAQGFDPSVARKVLKLFGTGAAQKLGDDPYRLLSFGANWRPTDAFARTHFGVVVDDPRRLLGAIEEACYRAFASGHTLLSPSQLLDALQGVLGAQTQAFRWRDLIQTVLSDGLSNGSFVIGLHGVQPLGAVVMERQIAQFVADRIELPAPPLLTADAVEKVLLVFEKANGIELNTDQRHAVDLAVRRPLVVIAGGLGAGKATLLKALYDVYDCVGLRIVQLALTGRSASRMGAATGRPASTIANVLCDGKDGGFDQRSVVVIDDASAVDITTMSRLCETLGPGPRLVLAGDPARLTPVGPGLVFQALMRVPRVAVLQLAESDDDSGPIAVAAASIREGRWPKVHSSPEAPIAFIPCTVRSSEPGETSISATVLRTYRQDPLNTRILCARRNGDDGSKGLNALCQSVFTATSRPVEVWDKANGAFASVGLHLGDPVLCNRNLWDSGLQNGSQGVIVQVNDQLRMLTDEEREKVGLALAWVDWDDGVRRPIVEAMIDDLELGYAITVRKAQGAQWPRVIVPITGHRLLDRTLVYTAVASAQRQVILIGDEAAARKAVESVPRAQSRRVSLDLTLTQLV